jgi:hypothetical protein
LYEVVLRLNGNANAVSLLKPIKFTAPKKVDIHINDIDIMCSTSEQHSKLKNYNRHAQN